MLDIGVISLFPEMFDALNFGVTQRAIQSKKLRVQIWNPRDWSEDAYRKVDDKPYGGGPGMVLMYEPMHQAIMHAKGLLPETVRTIYLSPQGKQIKQNDFNQLAQKSQSLLFVAGRYEGIDERLIENDIDEEWSLGDFVLSGGELAAMVFIDALARLLPGSLGHPASNQEDSHMHGLLDYPHFTRPAEISGLTVPDILLSGHHDDIARWRRQQSLGRTWLKRPDLLENFLLTPSDKALLDEFKSSLPKE